MDSPVQEIKERLDIVEVIGQYVKLVKAGANYKSPCPFHSEKSASFFVSPAKQIWRCFGCQKGGDAFSFIKEIEGVEFADALRILAVKAGVELRPHKSDQPEFRSERQRLYEICELGTKFFEKQLAATPTGIKAKNYLLSRGLTQESVRVWRLGWAPDTWRGLLNFLTNAGFRISEVEKAGLAISGSGGSSFDRFRGRIMFPIFDFYSQVVGFGGRIFQDKEGHAGGKDAKLAAGQAQPSHEASADAKAMADKPAGQAKYVNTPSTILYDKSRLLYGLDRAKVSIRKKDTCVVVEGYTDVIMSAQMGIDNVVSSSGTALTAQQLKLLKRFTDNLVLGYDMDLAGDSANKRGIDLAVNLGFNVSVARPPFEGKDPADVILQDPKDWEKAIGSSKSIMDYYIQNAFASNDRTTALGKKAIAKILLPLIKRIPNAIEQSHWMQIISQKLGVREQDLREELKKVKLEQYSFNKDKAADPAAQKSRNMLLEERLLTLAIKYRDLAKSLDDATLSFFSKAGHKIIDCLQSDREVLTGPAWPDFDAFAFRAEVEPIGPREAAQEFEFHINQIKKSQIGSELKRICQDLSLAQINNDAAALTKLQEEFNERSKSIQKLEEFAKNGNQNTGK